MPSGTAALSPWSTAVAAQIRAERAAAGLTQVQMFTRAGLTKTTYLRIERGTTPADVSQLGAITRALEMTLGTFIARAEQRL